MNDNPIWELKELMEEISQRCYSAGWLDTLSTDLWFMIQDGAKTRDYGYDEVQDWEIVKLKNLSSKAGGWWNWVEIIDKNQILHFSGEVFIPISDWNSYIIKSIRVEK